MLCQRYNLQQSSHFQDDSEDTMWLRNLQSSRSQSLVKAVDTGESKQQSKCSGKSDR